MPFTATRARLGKPLTGTFPRTAKVRASNKVAAKKLAYQIVTESPNASPNDVRQAWNLRQGIQDVNSVNQGDLTITKEGNQNVIAFQYRKEVPLVANMGVYMDFAVNTGSGK